MPPPITIRTTVLPGHRIEVVAPELREGDAVEVTVSTTNGAIVAKRSILEIIRSAPGHRQFKTIEQVDTHIREERDAWER